ncbi:MAG: DMT family transporter [Gammaproteobacteria bacterium]|nr:DMT family transporter [Gammaproteobacteria bacterium]
MLTKTIPENYLAVAAVLFSSAMWGLIWYPMRILDQAGMSAVWASLVMYIAAGSVALPFMIKKRFFSNITADLIWISLAAGVTNVAFLTALIEGEVMRVMLLFYLSPIWSVLLGRWWLGERLSPMAIVMFCLAIVGSLIMLWDPSIGWPWPSGLGDWLAIIGSIAFSINNVLARKLGDVSMTMKVGGIWWGVVLVSAVILLIQSAALPVVTPSVWLGAAGIGLFGMIAMNIAVLYGLARMPVYRAAVIMLFELIVAALSAWWLTEEVMPLQEWIGGALILVAGYGVTKFEIAVNE